MNPKLTPIATFGDFISIKGYGQRVFRVDSYTHEVIYERDASYEDIYYDCTCVSSSEYMLTTQEDATLVCKEAQATEFLKTYEHPKFYAIRPIDFSQIYVEVRTVNKPVANTKTLSKQGRIDALLDERVNVMQAKGFITDEDGYYARRIDEIDAQIQEVRAE